MLKKILVLSTLVIVSGCATRDAKFTYPVNHNELKVTNEKTKDKKVAVVLFDDLRENENYNKMGLSMIPLVPFASAKYDRPDSANMFLSVRDYDFDATEDLAKASAYSLNISKLFKNSYFTFGENKELADYILKGHINKFEYGGSMYTYGVSILAPYLWILGLPMGSSENTLDVGFVLQDAKTEKVLWEKSYSDNVDFIQGFYYNSGEDVKNFSIMYQKIMNNVISDLETAMSNGNI